MGPFFTHKAMVFSQCLGKGVDTIRKIWEEAFDEAAWRQPSVILLDDLDHVTAAPLGPEQEMGPEATYNSRLAQGTRRICSKNTYGTLQESCD